MKSFWTCMVFGVLILIPMEASAGGTANPSGTTKKMEKVPLGSDSDGTSPVYLLKAEEPPKPQTSAEPQKTEPASTDVQKEEPEKFMRDAITGEYRDAPEAKTREESLRDRVRAKMKD